MASFVAVNWSTGEMIDETSLDQINDNMVYLNRVKIEGSVNAGGVAGAGLMTEGLKIVAGRFPFVADGNNHIQDKAITFAKAFTASCYPIVATSLVCPGHRQVYHTIRGLDGGSFANPNGFIAQIYVEAAKDKNKHIYGGTYCNYIAIGW